MARVSIAKIGDIPEGEARVVDVAGHTLALFNVDGAYFALDNACVHRGGPLGEGDVDGRIVICPWHGWRWDVTTGANTNNPAIKVACFPVTVERDQIWVDLP